MKILKLLPLLIILSLYNSISFAEDCAAIKKDSSVNIIKKIKCNLSGSSSFTSSDEGSAEKNEGEWKLWKKPEWMKKKN